MSGEAEIEKLRKELIAARDENDRLNNSLNATIAQLDEMTRKYNDFAHGSGLEVLNAELKRFKDTATNAQYEFRAFLESVNLNDAWGKNDHMFKDLFDEIRDGSMTAGQAIMEVKTKFGHLIEQAGSGLDSKSVEHFNATMQKLAETVNDVSVRMRSIEQNGVKTIGDSAGGGGGNFEALLNRITAAAENMSEETKIAYERITTLVKAITDYAGIDDTKLLAVSQAFRNIADVGKGSYGTKSIENIISLIKQLQGIAPDGVLKLGLDVSGLQNIKVSKASLNNLATYLPEIAKVNVNKLKELSNVDFTNFSNLKVSKGAVEEISKIANAIQVLKETKAASIKADDSGITINESIKDTIAVKKQMDAEYLAYKKEQVQAEAEIEKSLTQAKKQDAKDYEAYKKERLKSEAEAEKELNREKKQFAKEYENYKKEQAKKEADFAKQVITAEKQAASEREKIERDSLVYKKKAASLLDEMTKAEKGWTKAASGSTKEQYAVIQSNIPALKEYLTKLDSGKITLGEFKTKIDEMSVSFKQNSAMIKAAHENTISFGDRISKLAGKFGAWLSITRIIMGVIRTIKQMVKTTIEVDSAMTQLQIVTKATDDTMAKFGETAATVSKEIGSSITDFTNSATTFARLGYSLDESSALAKYTAMLQNVGDIDVSDAQDSITSIIKAFNISTDQIESTMDKLVVTGKLLPGHTVMCA